MAKFPIFLSSPGMGPITPAGVSPGIDFSPLTRALEFKEKLKATKTKSTTKPDDLPQYRQGAFNQIYNSIDKYKSVIFDLENRYGSTVAATMPDYKKAVQGLRNASSPQAHNTAFRETEQVKLLNTTIKEGKIGQNFNLRKATGTNGLVTQSMVQTAYEMEHGKSWNLPNFPDSGNPTTFDPLETGQESMYNILDADEYLDKLFDPSNDQWETLLTEDKRKAIIADIAFVAKQTASGQIVDMKQTRHEQYQNDVGTLSAATQQAFAHVFGGNIDLSSPLVSGLVQHYMQKTNGGDALWNIKDENGDVLKDQPLKHQDGDKVGQWNDNFWKGFQQFSEEYISAHAQKRTNEKIDKTLSGTLIAGDESAAGRASKNTVMSLGAGTFSTTHQVFTNNIGTVRAGIGNQQIKTMSTILEDYGLSAYGFAGEETPEVDKDGWRGTPRTEKRGLFVVAKQKDGSQVNIIDEHALLHMDFDKTQLHDDDGNLREDYIKNKKRLNPLWEAQYDLNAFKEWDVSNPFELSKFHNPTLLKKFQEYKEKEEERRLYDPFYVIGSDEELKEKFINTKEGEINQHIKRIKEANIAEVQEAKSMGLYSVSQLNYTMQPYIMEKLSKGLIGQKANVVLGHKAGSFTPGGDHVAGGMVGEIESASNTVTVTLGGMAYNLLDLKGTKTVKNEDGIEEDIEVDEWNYWDANNNRVTSKPDYTTHSGNGLMREWSKEALDAAQGMAEKNTVHHPDAASISPTKHYVNYTIKVDDVIADGNSTSGEENKMMKFFQKTKMPINKKGHSKEEVAEITSRLRKVSKSLKLKQIGPLVSWNLDHKERYNRGEYIESSPTGPTGKPANALLYIKNSSDYETLTDAKYLKKYGITKLMAAPFVAEIQAQNKEFRKNAYTQGKPKTYYSKGKGPGELQMGFEKVDGTAKSVVKIIDARYRAAGMTEEEITKRKKMHVEYVPILAEGVTADQLATALQSGDPDKWKTMINPLAQSQLQLTPRYKVNIASGSKERIGWRYQYLADESPAFWAAFKKNARQKMLDVDAKVLDQSRTSGKTLSTEDQAEIAKNLGY